MSPTPRAAVAVSALALAVFCGAVVEATDAFAKDRDRNDRVSRTPKAEPLSLAGAIDFGDDASQWSNDGECDDPRFIGPGMTNTILLDEDIMHDATDCRLAYEAGQLDVNFGDDSGAWSNDGECDDPRFYGPGMTTTVLLEEDILRDATDCRIAFEAGLLTLGRAGGGGSTPPPPSGGGGNLAQQIDFGDDASQWSNDGECDDPRFVGPGMTSTVLLEEDVRHDATDCRTAYEAGLLDVNFGDDASQWSNDGECDDPRFSGPGMTNTALLAEDILHDATDCRIAFEAGLLTLK